MPTTFTKEARSATILTREARLGFAYILTDILDFILVGSAENETLVWNTPTIYTKEARP